MFRALNTTLHKPVDPKKLDKVRHVLAVDDESTVWLASVKGKFYFVPGDGDEVACLESHEIGSMVTSAVPMMTAPLRHGLLVESYTQGVLCVTPDGIRALHEEDQSGKNQIHALASDIMGQEFAIIDDAGQIVLYDLEGHVLSTHEPRDLMKLEFSKAQRSRLLMNQRWLVMVNLDRCSVLDRTQADSTPRRLWLERFLDVHLSCDTLMFHDSSTYRAFDLNTCEPSETHDLGHPFDVPIDITAMDFEARVIAGEGRHERSLHGFGAFDEAGYYGLHALHDKLSDKRISRISNIHEDLLGRLWLESKGTTSSRYLIFDGKGKPAKFKKG